MQTNDLPPSYSEAVTENLDSSIPIVHQNIINSPTSEHAQPYVQSNYAYPTQSNVPPPKATAPPPPMPKGYVPTYGSIPVTATMPTEIIIVNGCPVCRIGILETDFPCIGWFCAIAFFPIGVLFCLMMREKRCTHCGAQFST